MRIMSDQCRLEDSTSYEETLLEDGSLVTSPSHRILTISGHRLNTPIPGQHLEAVIAVDQRYLVFVAEGFPFEETLWVYLIDESFEMMDQATLFAIYSPGEFRDLQLESSDTLSFSFFYEDRWRLTVHQEKKRHIPLFGQPFPVYRQCRFFRYLTLRRAKL